MAILVVGVRGLVGDADGEICDECSDSVEPRVRSFGENAEAARAETYNDLSCGNGKCGEDGVSGHGALFGAVFVAMLPVAISQARDAVPAWIAQLASVFGTGAGHATFLAVDRFVKQPGLEPGIFGLILALVILFEPLGIYGRWSKIKVYFALFPLYKHATFRRQRAYMRSERLR